MKAVRIHDYGGPEVLRLEDAPLPAIGAHDARVRIVGASVNPVDWKIRQGHLRSMLAYPLPLTLGWDFSGIVEAVGERVTRVKPGDPVFSRPDIMRDGSYAEFIAVHEDELAIKPATVSHIEADSLPLACITAYQAIVDVAQVVPGQRVLVRAAAGGVGSLAVQIARECG
ncbi:MAG: NADP-dependent oxidoreductase, partial [Burkholderiaceae bacterium]